MAGTGEPSAGNSAILPFTIEFPEADLEHPVVLDSDGRNHAVLVLTAAVASAVVLRRSALRSRGARGPAGGRRLGALQASSSGPVPRRCSAPRSRSRPTVPGRTSAPIPPATCSSLPRDGSRGGRRRTRTARAPARVRRGSRPHPPVVWRPLPDRRARGRRVRSPGRAVHHNPAHECRAPPPTPSGTARRLESPPAMEIQRSRMGALNAVYVACRALSIERPKDVPVGGTNGRSRRAMELDLSSAARRP
jgi:hypothetical protein